MGEKVPPIIARVSPRGPLSSTQLGSLRQLSFNWPPIFLNGQMVWIPKDVIARHIMTSLVVVKQHNKRARKTISIDSVE